MNAIVETAEAIARSAHAGQIRKDGRTPVIEHPRNVAAIVRAAGASPVVIAAAWLHDTIEDTETTGDDIERALGAEVRAIVEQVSEPDKSLSWAERKRHTVETVEDRSLDALRVMAADKIDNLRSILAVDARGEDPWAMLSADVTAQRWYYTTLVERMRAQHREALFETFAQTAELVFGGTTH